ncbi:hypothetical protein [Flavobacterium sp. IMCC34518]|uniref:hypothetical protein n=1 Tax=Flavobacterium sp. IMCC34518 TaxID=3003623 RepID=UPI0022ABFEC3|nr:hypothetical protein [Flavobacterium sp. IMCC34518]
MNKTKNKAKRLLSEVTFKEGKINFAGIAFAFLWSSVSTATKIGLESAQLF